MAKPRSHRTVKEKAAHQDWLTLKKEVRSKHANDTMVVGPITITPVRHEPSTVEGVPFRSARFDDGRP